MDTWKKKVKVNKKNIEKKKVKLYYKQLWKNKSFRNLVTKDDVFVRASHNNKSIIKRKNVKIKNWQDLENQIERHAVEVHVPTKKTGMRYIDVDIKGKDVKNKKRIGKSIINKLRKQKVNVSMVTDSPSGVHIFSKSPKSKVVTAVKKIESEDKKVRVSKSPKGRKTVALDVNEPNTAIPGSLSIKGKPYKKWDDF